MSLIRKHGAVLQAWACLDLVFILFRAEKGHGVTRLAADSQRKNKSLALVKRLLHNTIGSQAAKPAVDDVALQARTDENVNRVEHRLKEHLIEDWRHFDQNVIDRAVNRWRDRLHKCIHAKGFTLNT